MTRAAGEDVPWAALYRRALRAGIGDEAFWRMSPAAILTVARGPRADRGAPGAPRRRGAAAPGSGGNAADCP